MVRAGTQEDFETIIDMAAEFWGQTVYSAEPFCRDTVRDMVQLGHDTGILSVVEIAGEVVGFACGIKGGLLGNRAIMSGTELAWWVNPEHRNGRNGIRLLQHIEKLAKLAGIKYWNMVFMESSMPATVEQIYIRMGYFRNEVVYTRVL